jgi:hypothetical protein
LAVNKGTGSSGTSLENSISEVKRCQWMAHYDNPAQSVVYLYDLVEDLDPVPGQTCIGRLEAPAEGTKASLEGIAQALLDAVPKIERAEAAAHAAAAHAEAAGNAAQAARETSQAVCTAVMGQLIPEHESAMAVKELQLRDAVKGVLKETQLASVDREIVDLYYQRNFSQNKIVEELRRQDRGKSKPYVGQVLRQFNAILKARGMKCKEKITGEPLPPDHGFGQDQRPEALTPENPATIAEAGDEGEEEVAATIETWDRASPNQKLDLEKFYNWLPQELIEHGRTPVKKPK